MEDRTEDATANQTEGGGALAAAPPTEEAIVEFLANNPDFLLRHPEAIRLLTPPSQRTGNDIVDFNRVLVDRLRAEIASLQSRENRLVDTVESNALSQGRVHRAVLEMVKADGLERLVEIVQAHFPSMLEVQAVSLCFEPAARTALDGDTDAATKLEPGATALLGLPGHGVLLRETTAEDRRLFPAEAGDIGSVAVLPLVVSPDLPPALLALGAARADGYHPNQGTELLTFLARITEACLRRWLKPGT